MVESAFKPTKVNKAVNDDHTCKLIFFILFTAVVAIRWYYVESFAVALPFWDQWDAEWVGLIKPWTEGKLTFADLWKNHNEHRILPTKLMTLLSLELTGKWSNLAEARLNILLGASTPLLLIWLLHKGKGLSGYRWLTVAVIVAGAVLPFSWENMLIGFQSQFYFLNLFTLSALALAVFRPHNTWAMLVAACLSILSALTMASGLITPLAVAMVYAAENYTHKKRTWKSLINIAVLVLISVAAYLTMPYVPGHNVLHAQNVSEMVLTAIRVMGWPLVAHKLYIGLLWLPTLIYMPVLLFTRRFKRYDLLMFGCFIWTGAQVLALAFGRGHELFEVSSRYTEVLLPGLAGNAWFMIRSTEEFFIGKKSKIMLRIIAFAFFGAVFFSHAQRFPKDIVTMKNDHETRLIQTKNVRLYLKTHDIKNLDKPKFQIPYPEAVRLQMILDDPGLSAILPPSVVSGPEHDTGSVK